MEFSVSPSADHEHGRDAGAGGTLIVDRYRPEHVVALCQAREGNPVRGCTGGADEVDWGTEAQVHVDKVELDLAHSPALVGRVRNDLDRFASAEVGAVDRCR